MVLLHKIWQHYRDNIEYRDILTHDDCHQLFLILPIPTSAPIKILGVGVHADHYFQKCYHTLVQYLML